MDNDNIVSFGTVKGGKDTSDENRIPTNDYVVVDMDDQEYVVNGFLIFTSQHLAIMRNSGDGAIPVLVLPLNRVKLAVLDEEDDSEGDVEV